MIRHIYSRGLNEGILSQLFDPDTSHGGKLQSCGNQVGGCIVASNIVIISFIADVWWIARFRVNTNNATVGTKKQI